MHSKTVHYSETTFNLVYSKIQTWVPHTIIKSHKNTHKTRKHRLHIKKISLISWDFLILVFNRQAVGGLTATTGKSRSTIFSMAAENVAENSTWFGWAWKAVKSSLDPNVIMKAWVNPCLSISMLSISFPLLHQTKFIPYMQ